VYPLPNLSPSVSRCAFLLQKMTHRLAEFLHQRLLQEKFAVQMVASGPEAQRFASNQSYDLVVLDLNRNGTVGLGGLRSIRLKKPDQPVLMVAGANVVEDRVRGLNAGADDFVAKPFEVAELAACILIILGGKSMWDLRCR
jgi:DNA-binding response OmpR family regulator